MCHFSLQGSERPVHMTPSLMSLLCLHSQQLTYLRVD